MWAASFRSQLAEHVTPFNDAMHMPNALLLAGRSLSDLASLDGIATRRAAVID
jgi:hypothetical protein